MADDFLSLLRKIVARQDLSQTEAESVFANAFNGKLSPPQIAALLVGLHVKGESIEEIAGAASAMRSKAIAVKAPQGAMDIVGTGGDSKHTLNISTATALVVAGAGVPVAKHGNRAITSKAGSADVLEALGISPEGDITQIEKAIIEANIGFLFARSLHTGMKHITPVRQELGVRTIFNILGPLCNPSEVKRLLVGVFDKDLAKPMAEVLGLLGAEFAWVVHGADGLDELSTTGTNYVCEYRGGKLREFELSPQDLGLATANLSDLQGGTAEQNAQRIEFLLLGEHDSFRDVVLLNAASALVISGRADDLQAGKLLAETSIDSGWALSSLRLLREIMADG